LGKSASTLETALWRTCLIVCCHWDTDIEICHSLYHVRELRKIQSRAKEQSASGFSELESCIGVVFKHSWKKSKYEYVEIN
jgi:hypothetical protein